jgi:hypothetical protein
VLGADLQRDPRFNCRPYPARGAKGFKAKDLCDVLMTVATGAQGRRQRGVKRLRPIDAGRMDAPPYHVG